jgi:hypothetical protein
MTRQPEPISINSSTITVSGVRGLGMIAVAAIIASTFAIARWLLLGGVAGGVILAAILIGRRRFRWVGGSRDDPPIVLFAASTRGPHANADTIEGERGRIEQHPRQQVAIR